MKKYITSSLLAVCLLPAVIMPQILERERQAVKEVIGEGYIQALYLKGDMELMKKHWHETCDIIYFEPQSKSIMKGNAIEYFSDYFQRKPGPINVNVFHEFTALTITGYAATAIVAVYNGDISKQLYTDHLSLYKFDDGWKIVGKTYYAYPKKNN